MISVTQLRAGATYQENGHPWRVITYKHTHMSRGSGTIRVRVKNLITGQVLERAYKSGERVEEIDVRRQELQYLYRDGEEFIFMDPRSFEQISVPEKVLGDDHYYLKEGESVNVLFWDEKPLAIDLPPKMVFTVAEAAPGEKGDSASNVYKDAKLTNGLKVRVPLFVNEGDKVRIDTRDGSYIERA